MNIYEKVLEARKCFLNASVKKSGRNNFQNFNYFELEDIVPTALKICSELKILPIFSMDIEMAHLKVIDMEKPEDTIHFGSPIPSISETNSNKAIQDIGKIQTYQRRYLYMQFLDIVEADAVDGAKPEKVKSKDKPINAPKPPKPKAKEPKIVEKKGTAPSNPPKKSKKVAEVSPEALKEVFKVAPELEKVFQPVLDAGEPVPKPNLLRKADELYADKDLELFKQIKELLRA